VIILKNNENEKSIKEMVQEVVMTDEKTSEEIHDYIDSRVRNEIIKQMNEFKEAIHVDLKSDIDPLYKMGITNDIYIHDINFKNYEIKTSLSEIIEKNDFKLIKIANKMGINRATLSNMIENPNSISLVNAFKISKLFGISIEDLFLYKIVSKK